MTTTHLTVAVRPPFSWAHSLQFVCGFPATRDEQLVDGEHLLKAWRIGGHTVVTRIGPGGKDALLAEVAADGRLTEPARAQLSDRLAFYLSADDDLAGFDRAAQDDPWFAPVAARMRGYHQVKFPSPAENLVWSILAQRTPMPMAREAKLRLMQRLNTPLEAFGSSLLPFPSLEQLAAVPEPELADLVRNRRKAGYLHGTLQRLLTLDEQFLRHGDVEQVRQALLALPGIGPWSSVFVLIRGLGRMEFLPRDAELLKAASAVYGRPLGEDDLTALSARYAPLQGYWAHYLRAGL